MAKELFYVIKNSDIVVEKEESEENRFANDLNKYASISRRNKAILVSFIQNSNSNRLFITVPEEITVESLETVKRLVEKICSTYLIDDMSFQNLLGDNRDYRQYSGEGNLMAQLEVFCKEKLGTLTKEEQEYLNDYRKFDLEALMSKDMSSNLINNENAGVIVISPTKYSEAVTTEMYHEPEIKKIIGDSLTEHEFELFNCCGICRKTQSIIIQIFKSNFCLWMPPLNEENKLSDFQMAMLEQINEKIVSVCSKHGVVPTVDGICLSSSDNINEFSENFIVDSFQSAVDELKAKVKKKDEN